MVHHIQGQGRHQVTLLPDALDDFVTEDMGYCRIDNSAAGTIRLTVPAVLSSSNNRYQVLPRNNNF